MLVLVIGAQPVPLLPLLLGGDNGLAFVTKTREQKLKKGKTKR